MSKITAVSGVAVKLGSALPMEVLDNSVVPPFSGPWVNFSDVMLNQSIPEIGNNQTSVPKVGFGPGGLRRGSRRWKQNNPTNVTPVQGVTNTMQEVRDYVLAIQKRVEVCLQNPGQNMTSKALLELQYLVQQLAFVNEVASKTADKTSQGLQTLFRNQG